MRVCACACVWITGYNHPNQVIAKCIGTLVALTGTLITVSVFHCNIKGYLTCDTWLMRMDKLLLTHIHTHMQPLLPVFPIPTRILHCFTALYYNYNMVPLPPLICSCLTKHTHANTHIHTQSHTLYMALSILGGNRKRCNLSKSCSKNNSLKRMSVYLHQW